MSNSNTNTQSEVLTKQFGTVAPQIGFTLYDIWLFFVFFVIGHESMISAHWILRRI